MPRKLGLKKSALEFMQEALEIRAFLEMAKSSMSDQHVTWAYEYGILRLYRSFEALMLDLLVGALNHDTSAISQQTGIDFPKHLTAEVCEYLVTNGKGFDFQGRDGLIKTIKRFVQDDHYLCEVVKQPKYKVTLEQLSALRNYAAHDSEHAKDRAKNAVDQQKIGTAGGWLKSEDRLEKIIDKLGEFAREIEERAPY
ncbi:hypothetical protein [Tuwongella immobilis]|uniref:RiboL-PSP-HEPN domain-containing protein n=1 Tax=Tuwongella immobilis TaxID=692036 RepID=A0A6C2YVF5_9BACT|nr:hypothetical protein [Tuwongella immobilis]VIP05153.1 unnamed protein product [Tuwongella immobilis]VTS07662.1 unnamed protein product [Tuwongella immobilis]